MSAIDRVITRILFPQKIDPGIKVIMNFKKTKQIPIIIQSLEGTDKKLKKCIKKYGGTIKNEYPFINACLASVPPDCIKALEALYQVTYISMDYPLAAHLNNVKEIIGTSAAHNLNYTGKNITVALLDTGTYPHPDIIRPRNRILKFVDLINDIDFAYDDNGHGTFISGIIAGNGSMSKGDYSGVAPQANLVSLKVLNQSGNGKVSTVLSGLQWIYDNREKYRIRIVCLALGCSGHIPWDNDPLSRAAQALWDAGLVVCTSAGNNGPHTSSISSPGTNPNIITAGAVQAYGSNIFPSKPLCIFSGRGPTRDGNQGPDVVAPGSNIISLNCDTTFIPKSMSAYKAAKLASYYRRDSGTSAACAAITGIVTLMLDKEQQLTPEEVKSLLKHSCKSLNLLKVQQGWGIPNMNKLLE